MGIAAKVPQVRYSAAYPTGRERIVFSRLEHVEHVEVLTGLTGFTGLKRGM